MSAIVIHRPSIQCFLFVSGQVGSHDGSPEHDLKAQVRLAFKILMLCSQRRVAFEDVVDVTLFVVDLSQISTLSLILPEYWEKRLTLR